MITLKDTYRDEMVEDMLRRRDKMAAELSKLETELRRECVQYGLRRGIYGYRPDHLRIRMMEVSNG